MSEASYGQREDADVVAAWTIEQGFRDGRNAVRLWVDPDTRRLVKLRVSPQWRERLKGRSLEDALAEVFILAGATRPTDPLAPPAIVAVEPDPDLGWHDLPDVLERIAQVRGIAQELARTPAEEVAWADFRGKPAIGRGAGGKVTVTLNIAGLTQSVRFDRDWLADASSDQISGGVEEAHRRAYVAYCPPTFIPGEHDELAQHYADAHAQLEVIMSKAIL